MSSSLINSANAPVAKDNVHLDFRRFVKLDSQKLEASIVFPKVYNFFP